MPESADVQLEDRWKKLSVAAGLLAPLLALLVSLMTGPFDAAVDGDDALFELGVRQTSHGANKLGPYSRFHFHHPGPTIFLLMSPLYYLAGESHGGLLWTAVLLNAAAVWLIHRVVRPRRWTAALCVAILTSLLLASMGVDRWYSAWSGNLPALPFAAAVFSFAAAASGRTIHLLPALTLATLAVQTHAAYALPTAAVGLAALTAMFFPHLVGSPERPAPSLLRVLGLAALPALLWLPPLVEELSTGGGNLSELIAFFSLPHSGIGAGAAMGIVGDRFTAFLLGPLEAPAIVRVLSAALALALPTAYLRSLRSGDTLAASLGLLSLAGLAGAVFATARVVGPLHGHLVAWIPGLGLAASSALVLAFLQTAARRTRPLARMSFAWALTALFLTISLLNLRDAWLPGRLLEWANAPRHLEVVRLAESVRMALRQSSIAFPEVRIATSDSWPTAAATLLRLHKEGVRFCVEDAWLFQYGAWFSCRGRNGESGSAPRAPDGLLILGGREFEAEAAKDPRFRRVAAWEEGGIFLSRTPLPPEEIDFAAVGAPLYLAGGFTVLNKLEPGSGRWSIGPSSLIALPLKAGAEYNLEILALPLAVPGRVQTVQVELNGAPITLFPMVDRELAYFIRLPAENVREINQLRFRYAYWEPPMLYVEDSEDWRPLGVRFRKMRITRVQ